MEGIFQETSIKQVSSKSLHFQVPTPITNLEPIFIFKIILTQHPSFAITLNPDLIPKSLNHGSTNYAFKSDGNCSFIHQDQNDYFIKGELKLLDFNDSDNKESSHCKMSITYGKGKSELFYLKGTFKLSEFEQN